MLNAEFDKAHVDFTFSCYTTTDEELAKAFFETATIYKAQTVDAFGKREK